MSSGSDHRSVGGGAFAARARAIATLLSGLAGLLVPVGARAGDLSATVIPVPNPVTHATTGQPTYAAYVVTLVNSKPQAIQGVRLIGTTTVVGATQFATYRDSSGNACGAASPGQTSVSCPLGSLAGNGGSATFTVTFNAPTAGSTIDFAWSAVFDESGGGGSDGDAGTAQTTLQAPQADAVTSYVPAATGGTFFTGTSGVATSSEKRTTTVSVPAGTATTAQVVQADNLQSCSSDVTLCNLSTLTIPGSFTANLVIILRRDVSTIRKGAKIANAVIRYEHVPDVSGAFDLQSCDLGGPAPGVPCIKRRTDYTKKTAPTPDFVGDWEFEIWAVDNGRIGW